MNIVNNRISEERVKDLIVTALEGGSNYWYWIKVKTRDLLIDNSKLQQYNTLSEKLAAAVVDLGVEIDIHDAEEHDDLLGTITQESINKALELMEEDYIEELESVEEDAYDTEDADIFFQLAVMGEIVFG